LPAEAEDQANFVVTGTASAYLPCTMKIKRLPAGFIIPAQPVLASRPPSGSKWVHEIKHDGEDMRNRPFHKAALTWLLRNTKAGILFNEHIVEDGLVVFAHACRLGAKGIVSKKDLSTGPCRVWIKVRNPASLAVQRERSELWNG
jgi:ATP-dependent DNA ligase